MASHVHTIILSPNGFTSPVSYLYTDYSRYPYAIFADAACTQQVTSVPVPYRVGYTFSGYYRSSTQYIDANGAIDVNNLYVYSSNHGSTTLVAQGVARAAAVYLYHQDGTGYDLIFKSLSASANMYGDDLCTGVIYSVAIPIRNGYRFAGYYTAETGGTKIIDEAGNILTPTAGPLYAQWTETAPEKIFDYFGLASSALVPIASQSGDQKRRVAAANGGRYSADVNDTGCIWRNPSVTYMIVQDTTIALTLGKSFCRALDANNAVETSGYMMTSALVSTEVKQFPTVTVSAVANEGADAINLFNVSIPVVARARAQNLCDAFDSSARIIQSSIHAVCDPVVLEDKLVPCASDAVNGRLEASADVLVLGGESAPGIGTGGFALAGSHPSRVQGGFQHYTIEAIKEIN